MTRQKVRHLSDTALAWTMADLRSVIHIQERGIREGLHCPKLGRYWDDLHVCVAERSRRNIIWLRAQTGRRKGGAR